MHKMVVVTFKIEVSLLEELDKICRRVGRSRSDLIREGILEVIRRYKNI